MAVIPPLNRASMLRLHIREANASLTKSRFYAILRSKDGDIVANDKLSEHQLEQISEKLNMPTVLLTSFLNCRSL